MKRYSFLIAWLTILPLYTRQHHLMVSGLLRPTVLSSSLCRRCHLTYSILESACIHTLTLAYNKKDKHDVDEKMSATPRNTGDLQSQAIKDSPNDEQINVEQSPTSRQLVARVKLLHTRHTEGGVYNIPADKEEQWDFFYQMLQTAESMSSTDVRQSILRSWCAEQRKSYMKTLGVLDLGLRSNWGTEYLTKERKGLLDSAEFDWGHLKHVGNDELVFSKKFQATVQVMYKESTLSQGYQAIAKRNAKLYMEHGVTDLPIIRGNTVAQKKIISDMLSDSKLKRSRRYKFDVEKILPDLKSERKIKKKIIPWSQRISDLKIFIEKHGHCNVPTDFDEADSLGKWVKRQKNNRKLSLKNRAVLEDLGFEFNFK